MPIEHTIHHKIISDDELYNYDYEVMGLVFGIRSINQGGN